MKLLLLTFFLTFSVWAKTITPNEVYSQVMLITKKVHFLLDYYQIKHSENRAMKYLHTSAHIKPRNVWQMTYEIMVKINILRNKYNLPTIEPVNMTPVLNLNPDLVYEQTQRILTELKIFETRNAIKTPFYNEKTYNNKTPLDVFNALTYVSKSFDKLNGGIVTPSYVFGEQMRVYDDISLILQKLNIKDNSIPKEKKLRATPEDTFAECMKILNKVKELQITTGIDFVDFSEFQKNKISVSSVYTITEMIISEIQTIKAQLNIKRITPAASEHNTKTPAEALQLTSWNFRKLQQIDSLTKEK